MSTATIFVCEDDATLRGSLVRSLREEQFDAQGVGRGAELLRLLGGGTQAKGNACVIDIGLPDCDGRDLCQAMRSRGLDLPVIFLTAKIALPDRLSGFAAGGDDYLGKPFAFAELLARLEALLRRRHEHLHTELELDPGAHTLRCHETIVYLTPTEFHLLACLVGAGEAAVSRKALLRAGWPTGARMAENTLDAYVAHLRHKLASLDGAPRIATVRGVGYRLT